MWPLPRTRTDLVCVCLTPTAVACSWFARTRVPNRYELKAYERTPLEHTQHSFNPAHLHTHIQQFINKHNLHDAFLACSITASQHTASLITLPTPVARPIDFNAHTNKKLVWDYTYLFQQDQSKHVYYLCGMHREQLLRYQLLAIKLGLQATTFITPFMAHLQVYRSLYGAAFRRAQFAQDMQALNNNISAWFTADKLRRTLRMPSQIEIKTELPFLTTTLGLFLAGNYANP